MTDNKNILTLKGVNFSYNAKREILSDINFSLLKGELLGIIGPNGSGKTTLLNIISGILKPNKGEISLLTQNLNKLPIEKIAKFISVVPQDTWVTFNFKAKEVVFMGRMPYISRIKGETINDYQISREAMVKTHCLSLSENNIQEISGGERQRIFLAKALAQTPRLLLLDEFTSHLDLKYKYEMLKLLKIALKEDDLTIISTFHDLNLASIASDRLLLLNEGKIEKMGTPQEVLNEENLQKAYGAKPILISHPGLKVPQIIM
ncbi:MAG: ABC transporter ATP-binding protein [Candidatus Caldatribacteriota bacterium]|nr:ABC transporter ATP-binding protein [Candidatus Caldatribacteriota bacterium]